MHSSILQLPQAFYEVAIVGAGAAGLEAAREFLKRGVKSLIVLEGSDRIGGRVNTIATPSGPIELGAQWIHGEVNNKLFDINQSDELIDDKLSLDGGGDFLTENGELIPQELVEEVSEVMNSISSLAYSHKAEDANEVSTYASIGDFFQSQFKKYLDSCNEDSVWTKRLKLSLYHWTMRWERIDNACDSLHQLSARRYREFQHCEGRDNMNPKYGMVSFIHSIFKEDLPLIKTNCKVIKINFSNKVKDVQTTCTSCSNPPVTLQCSNGLSVGCNHVLVTCSIGHLKARIASLFSPQLPTFMQKAINNTGFGTLDKIFLEFEYKWWNSDNVGFQFVWAEKIPNFDRKSQHIRFIDGTEAEMKDYWYYAISGFEPLFDGRPILCGWSGGPEAEFMERLPDQQVAQKCTELLRRFTGNPSIPEPIGMYRSCWASEPLFCGSYCHRGSTPEQEAVSSKDLNTPIFATDERNREFPVIALAGEANSLSQYSTIHGAIDNGRSQTRHYLSYRERYLVNELQSKL